MQSPDISPLASVPMPLTRGVYCEQIEPNDETVYYGIMSTGQLLNGELRHRLPDETEMTVVREIWRDLRRQDPTDPTPPRLALVR